MDLWQNLSDNTPRKVPEFFIDTLKKYKASEDMDSPAQSTSDSDYEVSDDSGCGAILFTFIFYFSFIICIILLACHATVLSGISLTIAIITAIIPSYISRNKHPNIIFRTNDEKSDEKLLNLITDGRKTVARISAVTYIPINYVEEKRDLLIVHDTPSFLVKYVFNPPDDARSEDLVHEFISHAAPENQYAPGDPLPILYKIDKDIFNDFVYSMPYPYPVSDARSSEVVFRSNSPVTARSTNGISPVNTNHSIVSYDYRNHYLPLIASANNREKLLKLIANDIWLVDDASVAALILNFASSIFHSDDFELRSAMVVSLLKSFHCTSSDRTRDMVIQYLKQYFNMDFDFKPSKEEFIAVYKEYTYNDLPVSFWNIYTDGIKALDQSAFINQNEWPSNRLELPGRVNWAILERTGRSLL
jgi:hypothetical protein